MCVKKCLLRRDCISGCSDDVLFLVTVIMMMVLMMMTMVMIWWWWWTHTLVEGLCWYKRVEETIVQCHVLVRLERVHLVKQLLPDFCNCQNCCNHHNLYKSYNDFHCHNSSLKYTLQTSFPTNSSQSGEARWRQGRPDWLLKMSFRNNNKYGDV